MIYESSGSRVPSAQFNVQDDRRILEAATKFRNGDKFDWKRTCDSDIFSGRFTASQLEEWREILN
jgi:hypothetical protein